MTEPKMTVEAAMALRRPFPPESIGRLPKGGQMLDFAGHAAVTDRLLAVDPEWSWEPLALGPDGLPAYDRHGNLWIKLTICGVTRLGVGDGKQIKEIIGDALRNAGMRFGIGLDLWAKENLVEFAQAANRPAQTGDSGGYPAATSVAEGEAGSTPASDTLESSPLLNTRGQLAKRMFAAMGSAGITDRDDRLAYVSATVGRTVGSSDEMTDTDASLVIAALAKQYGAEAKTLRADA